jgi:nitroreductase
VDVDLHEAMSTQRAIRRLLDDPVDDEVIKRCLGLAVKAPTGGNLQGWQWIVVRDQKVKSALGRQNKLAWNVYGRVGQMVSARLAGAEREAQRRLIAAVDHQAEHWDQIPVIIVACIKGMSWPMPWIYRSSRYGSIYPAVQNLLLAARAEGLGATLTTLPLWNRVAARRILGLPWNVEPVAVVPLGWPKGKYGPTKRAPIEDITHIDRYGNQPWKNRA